MIQTLLLLLVVISIASAQEPTVAPSRDLILGKAGSTLISEDEFVRRFELLPGLNRHRLSRLNEEKLIVMYSLVAEKLLAAEAEARGIERDSAAVAGMQYLTELLARDELYRQEIMGKVSVSTDELRKGVRNAMRKLLLTYLFFQKEEDARFVASQLHGQDLKSFAVDSSMQAFKDTVTVVYGTAEPEIEDAAFALKKGETSPVVRTSKGYFILQLTSDLPNLAYMGMQPSVRRERVTDHLRLRKEEERLNAFMAEFLPGHKGYAVPSKIKAAAIAVSAELTRPEKDSLYVLAPEAREGLQTRLQSAWRDTFMVAGTRVYSVRDVIDRLLAEGFSTDDARPLAVAGKINAQARVWVQQELLAQEAMRRGLDRTPEVQRQIKEWREFYLAQMMRARVEDSVSVTDAEVYRYLEQNGHPLPVPRIRIRELTTASLEDMRRAIADLDNKVPFAEVVQRYSSDEAAKARGGLSAPFPITGRPPIGDIASQMSVGQFYGPIPVQNGLLLFELVERKDSARVDTSMAVKKRETAAELLRLLRKDTLERFIAGAAARHGYSVFEDRLASIKVSPVPMVSFRVLGFGGRLFAAPMLPRMFEWINIQLPKPAVAP